MLNEHQMLNLNARRKAQATPLARRGMFMVTAALS
jgi:hypothetical protein